MTSPKTRLNRPSVACGCFILVVFLNFVVAFVFALLALWFYWSRRSYEPLLSNSIYTASLITVGSAAAAVAVVGVLGVAAALMAKRWQIITYVFMIVLFGLGVGTAGVISLFFNEQVRQMLDSSLNKTMAETYGMEGQEFVTDAIDLLQASMPCCGYILYNDWLNSEFYRDADRRNGTSAPLSCCLPEFKADLQPRCNEGFPFPLHTRKLHQRGCLPLLESWYRRHSYVVGVAASALSGFLLLSSFLSLHYYREASIRSRYDRLRVKG